LYNKIFGRTTLIGSLACNYLHTHIHKHIHMSLHGSDVIAFLNFLENLWPLELAWQYFFVIDDETYFCNCNWWNQYISGKIFFL